MHGVSTMGDFITPKEAKKLFGSATCNAKTRAGGLCKNAPIANRRCRMHSGKSSAGIAHPRFKHGRYSKDMVARLAGQYLEEHPEEV